MHYKNQNVVQVIVRLSEFDFKMTRRFLALHGAAATGYWTSLSHGFSSSMPPRKSGNSSRPFLLSYLSLERTPLRALPRCHPLGMVPLCSLYKRRTSPSRRWQLSHAHSSLGESDVDVTRCSLACFILSFDYLFLFLCALVSWLFGQGRDECRGLCVS